VTKSFHADIPEGYCTGSIKMFTKNANVRKPSFIFEMIYLVLVVFCLIGIIEVRVRNVSLLLWHT